MDPVKDTLNAADDVAFADIKSFASAAVQVSGTYSGTVTFEASVDGSTWSAANMIVQATGAISSTTTSTGLFILANSGYAFVRARMSSYTSGAAAVAILGGAGSAFPAAIFSSGNFWSRVATDLSPTTSGDTMTIDGITVTTLTVTTGTATTFTAGTSQVTGSRTLGGTGVAAAAKTLTEITKAVTGFSDTVAKDVFTVTIPNAAHAAVVECQFVGVLGAGGAVGAGEAVCASKYQFAVVRTAGKNAVVGVSSAIGGAKAKVSGGDDITSVVATASAISGAVGASNSFTIQVAITRSGAGADNHTLFAEAKILNGNATGISLA